jgi:hypothetical protein
MRGGLVEAPSAEQPWLGGAAGRGRMLGTFLTEDPTGGPDVVVGFVADQLGMVHNDLFQGLCGQAADGVRARLGYPWTGSATATSPRRSTS